MEYLFYENKIYCKRKEEDILKVYKSSLQHAFTKEHLKADRERLLVYFNWLKREWPIKKDIKLSHSYIKAWDTFGVCHIDKDPIIVQVESRDYLHNKIDNLLHEYAHALAFNEGDLSPNHNSKFWKYYSQIYKKVFDTKDKIR